MKIIQHGRYYEPPQTANCRNCRCIFSYEDNEVREERVAADYTPRYVRCPECGWEIEVEDES